MKYFQVSLSIIFVLVGIILAFYGPHSGSLNISLGALLGILVILFAVSFLVGKRKPAMKIAPGADDLEEIAQTAYKKAKKLVILVVGVTVCLGGVLMIVLPGPAVVVIPMGLAILATEFAWARRLLTKAKNEIKNLSQSNGKKQ